WPVITVHFSNHTGYGAWKGPILPAEDVAAVIEGIEERGVLPTCNAVLSGYMGDVSLGRVILDAAARVKAANGHALYCCDPVMGDVGRGFFVRPGIPEFMRDHAVPAADIITPNQFELEFLTGIEVDTLEHALRAAEAARKLGPEIVLVTSLQRSDSPADAIELLAVSGDGAWLVRTPLLPISVNGAGDMTAALFLAHYMKTGNVAQALGRATASVFAVMEATANAGAREIQLIAAQDQIAHPPPRFAVEAVR
ncbi:MAG: pyridoxal kinase PdxY, partial [Inquilinus sp.]|nr:pyridoxal kinase PdxY [Inquilinus sp.]